MATTVGIVGHSGTGKTHAVQFLDPKTTYIVNSDLKALGFRGWKKNYNADNKNYSKCSDFNQITAILKAINERAPHIKTIVIDTVNGCMTDDELRRRKEKGYDKWMDLAGESYDLVKYCNLILRDELVVVLDFHEMEYKDDDGMLKRKILTNGKMLEKIVLETKLPIVLFTRVEGEGDDSEFFFETKRNCSTAKSPEGMFESFKIENNLKLVVDAIEAYEN